MTPPPPSRLPFFVYGTLRPGQANHPLVEGRTAPPRPAVLPGALLYAGPGYPYAVAAPAAEPVTDTVHGELLDVLPDQYDTVLADLDRLEDHVPGARGNLYERLALRVICDGLRCDAWVYLAGEGPARTLRASGRIIPGGDWVRTQRSHRPYRRS
ncbi:gamma-glutamylcyclotransferase [Streptomyces sp. SID13666]|uniref:gamma-glutamylcyclotransferase family protein n=1 Tax=Streptomyces TaxID=1883 RepID=UPI0011075C60|nr:MULTISPECIES: gamma-glutamylcyclotransferase family protein [Streptomyces]MCZ4096302.1 gamma-glutamylcyclotransferase [Streptomyces sp. H39-C1]NEA55502.1 gamma-glutamylcyclotransferase [Streptomyces sp. SID13666]NEA71704.1 gamma-glutamylcyclotransferase [Streptomyces sp. SID13588]QNA73300.1 gamma-glutamylcyclotransferase [Streptomyces sp. So13.3]